MFHPQTKSWQQIAQASRVVFEFNDLGYIFIIYFNPAL